MQKNAEKCRKMQKNAEKICTIQISFVPLQRKTKTTTLTTDR